MRLLHQRHEPRHTRRQLLRLSLLDMSREMAQSRCEVHGIVSTVLTIVRVRQATRVRREDATLLRGVRRRVRQRHACGRGVRGGVRRGRGHEMLVL